MNIKQTLKKEYEAPEMSVLDYEYSDCLLVDSQEEFNTEDPPVCQGNCPLG